MQLTYALAKRDGAWSVVESTPRGSNFSHPALDKAQAPAAGGTMSGDSAIFRTLDNFHGGAAKPPQNLPPGHPPITASPKEARPEVPSLQTTLEGPDEPKLGRSISDQNVKRIKTPL